MNHLPINQAGRTLGLSDGRVVLQDGRRSLLFEDAQQIVTIEDPGEVRRALRYIVDHVDRHGYYAAGFLTYEAAAAYDLATHSPAAGALPLLWFGLYEQPKELEVMLMPYGEYEVGTWHAALDWPSYQRAVEAIKANIAAGHTYQVNYTMPLRASFTGDPWALYRQLAQSQQAQFMAYLDLGRFVICSASPELFFMREGDRLTARPMKGTAHRGRTLSEDHHQMAWLKSSAKNRAENVMIVDMIRNDFGRIAEIGSVEVPELFTVERYPTLLQMTSTVTARSTLALPDIMRAMFPCASITGAPKVRTMEIIKDLEPQARGVYTGAIGYIAPNRRASFNVAIRTVVIDRRADQAVYGVGSGIVWDSEAELEYQECFLKADVLVRRQPSFQLLETMRWTPGDDYFLLDHHLQRLAESAEYFDFPCSASLISTRLQEASSTYSGATRVRLLLDKRGELTIQAAPLPIPEQPQALRCALAREPVSAADIWLFHKTTNRRIYEEARTARPHVDEVILWNEDGELTEATMSNVVLDIEGRLLTPPLTCGLLNGTMRRHLLQTGEIHEERLTLGDLQRSRKVYLINSVRLWQDALIVDNSQA